MEVLLDLVAYIGPMIAALVTVPILNGIKSVVTVIDRAPALVKQIAAVVIAYGLTYLGGLVDQQLPGELSLFTGEDIEALVAAGIAMAVHAGRKSSDP